MTPTHCLPKQFPLVGSRLNNWRRAGVETYDFVFKLQKQIVSTLIKFSVSIDTVNAD